uniref:Uncharacterized protein n=1 Tax=Rhizophora mucronata TaxID=61149 RepID=A0A2P2NWT5_RHIMU
MEINKYIDRRVQFELSFWNEHLLGPQQCKPSYS